MPTRLDRVHEPLLMVATPLASVTAVFATDAEPAGEPSTANVTVAPDTVLLNRSNTVTESGRDGLVATVADCPSPEAMAMLVGPSCVAVAVNVTWVVVPSRYTPKEFVPTVVDSCHAEFAIVATPFASVMAESDPGTSPAGVPSTANVTVAPTTVLPKASRTVTENESDGDVFTVADCPLPPVIANVTGTSCVAFAVNVTPVVVPFR